MSLLPAERAQYAAIIDKILASGDLTTISAKQIRRGLQDAIEEDISGKKQAVQELIMERFDKASTENAHTTSSPPPTNGSTIKSEPKVKKEKAVKTEDSDEEDEPPKKKRKQVKGEMDDEKLAAMLQEQENRSSRATRGGDRKAKAVKKEKKKPRKKSEKKVKADDDSDIELNSEGEPKEKVKKGGFHKQYHLSAPLADLVGEPTLSRPQVVKKIWEYIKARDLQDPTDKRNILCDNKMQLVFKTDKVHMFTMNKILGNQLYPVDE